MRDIGYGVRLEGDPYKRPAADAFTQRAQGLELAKIERLILPRGAIE
jgi:hypothetical protein